MIYKPRTKSVELTTLELLNRRMKLDAEQMKSYINLSKGYAGEVLFDSFTERLSDEYLVLNDLLFEVNNTIFQIDALIIAKDRIYVYEIKTFEGDYLYEYQSDKLFKRPRFEVINPLHQQSRSESLLQQLLRGQGINLQIDSSIVFIDSSFVLYQAPTDKPIIFYNQLERLINQLNNQAGALTSHHKKVADRLMGLHKSSSVYQRLPRFGYGELRKGMPCLKCHSFSGAVGQVNYICKACNYSETVETTVLRSIEEFRILFPERKVTTKNIYEWCSVVRERRIRNVLLKHFLKKGDYRSTYFS